MATYRRLESGGSGNFWKPKDPGSSIEGVFEGRESGDYGSLLLFRDRAGVVRKVPMTSRLEDVLAQLQEGVTYKLTFVGILSIKGGKTLKDIVVDELVDDGDGEVETSATAADEPPF